MSGSGIAGLVYKEAIFLDQMTVPMLETLAHRGLSSGKEVCTFKNFQLGICGCYLGSNDKKTIFSALDGDVLNIQELRAELKHHNIQIENLTPASILAFCYELWGPAFLEKLRGEFVIVILDKDKETLLLARDRIGKKPLYWYQNDQYFLFASELKALHVTGLIPENVAKDGLAAYLYLGYIPQDLTPFQDVNKLLPGYYIALERDMRKVIQPYWSYSTFFLEPKSISLENVSQRLDLILQESIRLRMQNKQSLGCFLSGGIGSTIVANYLRHLTVPPQPYAFTVTFETDGSEELDIANEVTRTLHLQHTNAIITPEDFFAGFVPMTWHLDEPIADPFAFMSWNLAKLASTQIGAVFSGMGSGEFLEGEEYCSEFETGNVSHYLQWGRKYLEPLYIKLLSYLYKPFAIEALKISDFPSATTFLQKAAIMTKQQMAIVAPELATFFDPSIFLHRFYPITNMIHSPESTFVYLNLKTRLVDSQILQYERSTAAHGLDWQTPFLDHILIEFFAGIQRIGHISEKDRSLFLTQMLHPFFSSTFIDRSKYHPHPFLKGWLENQDLLAIFQMLPQGVLTEAGFISQKWLKQCVSSPENILKSYKILWSIFALEVWYRIFIEHRIQAETPNIDLRSLFL